MTENEDQDDTWEQYQMKRDEAFAKAVGQILGTLRAMNFNNAMFTFILFLAITTNTCVSAGCVTFSMEEWRDEVAYQCVAGRKRLHADCGVPAPRESSCDDLVDEMDRCLGQLERVFACVQRPDVVVACSPWGPDIGSQCDVEEWELRTCIYPELRTP